MERIVARAVQRERERARIVGEDVRRPVALVHVAVDHQHAVGEPVAPQRRGRHRDVVEEAVAAREVAPGVVRAAAEVHRDVVLDRVARGRDGARDRAAPALDQLARPRQPEAALLADRQAAFADAREQAAVMDGGELVPSRRDRLRSTSSGAANPSATTRSASSPYFSIGNEWCGGSGKRQRWWVQTCT